MTDACLEVTVSAASREEADRIAGSAVAARLAACAQVSGPVASTYWWEGRVQQADEWRCLLKTSRARFADLERHIRGIHSYDTPDIIATIIAEASADYLAWLRDETASPTREST